MASHVEKLLGLFTLKEGTGSWEWRAKPDNSDLVLGTILENASLADKDPFCTSVPTEVAEWVLRENIDTRKTADTCVSIDSGTRLSATSDGPYLNADAMSCSPVADAPAQPAFLDPILNGWFPCWDAQYSANLDISPACSNGFAPGGVRSEGQARIEWIPTKNSLGTSNGQMERVYDGVVNFGDLPAGDRSQDWETREMEPVFEHGLGSNYTVAPTFEYRGQASISSLPFERSGAHTFHR